MTTTTTRARPRSLPSTTTRLQTEMGDLFVTVCVDEDGEPFEVFGALGKGGSFQHGATELTCRLVSLHLRRGTPLDEVIGQMQGIAEMQPFWNRSGDGRSVAIRGLGDGIAQVLKAHLKARERRWKRRKRNRRRPRERRHEYASTRGRLLRGTAPFLIYRRGEEDR